ncbi:MAG: hypothetical protein IIY06_02295, partial [Proteobacteria bacterium]|nr:hypothetical protein [Pseudomonadota bacterium]
LDGSSCYKIVALPIQKRDLKLITILHHTITSKRCAKRGQPAPQIISGRLHLYLVRDTGDKMPPVCLIEQLICHFSFCFCELDIPFAATPHCIPNRTKTRFTNHCIRNCVLNFITIEFKKH